MREICLKVNHIAPVAKNIFILKLKGQNIPAVKGGQFLQLQTPNSSLLLRRPFCIYDCENNIVTIYFAVVGKGTKALSELKIGNELKAILPLGNGFDIDNYKNIGLLGGGMGVAALHLLAKQNPNKDFYAFFGFSDISRVAFVEDFKRVCKEVNIFTSNGSYQNKGRPVEPIAKFINNLDAVMICGPHGLVKSAQSMSEFLSVPTFASLEQRMACGIGACMVCTCLVNGQNKRVCADGPVFKLNELKL